MILLISLCDLAWWQILLSWLLPFLLGWWLAKISTDDSEDSANLKAVPEADHDHHLIQALESELAACRSESKDLKEQLDAALEQHVPLTSANTLIDQDHHLISISSKVPESAFLGLVKDNLQIIEGIGPKMDEFLKGRGIEDWDGLADQNPDQLKTLLEAADSKYRIIDPATWPEQAALARDSKWYDLIDFQRKLSAGKELINDDTNSKLESILIKLGLLKKYALNDLKAVEGIGPKIEHLLNEAGITTWNQLAHTSLETLKEILDKAGERYQLADPSTWSKQAAMASEGQWKELFEYQDRLDGGKEV